MKIALVHDFLTRLGGAERVLKTLSTMYPKAPIYNLLYDENKVGGVFPREKIVFSSLQKFPSFVRNRQKYLLPIMPRAVEEWDFSQFDIVISSSSAFSHGIITPTHTKHISYCHSPMRYAWDWSNEYLEEQRIGTVRKMAIAHLLKKIRMWDIAAVDRADKFLANSRHVRRRIKKYYRRESDVVYPPVDLSRFSTSKNSEDYFLIISTLTPYKRVELAIQLFNRIRRKLVIIGEGPHRNFLQAISGDTIQFLGYQSDEVALEYMKNCKALIFPGEEDFGITPVEAMACGKPVLAFGEGGVTESVIEGITGEFFNEPTPESMEQGLARLLINKNSYNPKKCREQAEKFSEEHFVRAIKKSIQSVA